MQTKRAHNEKHFSSSKRNDIKDEIDRSTTGITRVLLDVSCSSCSLSDLVAWHSSRLLAIYRVFFRSSPADAKQKKTQFGLLLAQ